MRVYRVSEEEVSFSPLPSPKPSNVDLPSLIKWFRFFEFAECTSWPHHKEKRLRCGAVSKTASYAMHTGVEHGTDHAITAVLRDGLAKNAAGLKTHGGIKYETEVQRLTGLMPAGSTGINHGKWA